MSPRTAFLAALYTGPLLRADAVVVLAGEDAQPRLDAALQLLAQQGAPTLVLTGGVDDATRTGAEKLRAQAMGRGVKFDSIRTDTVPTNTREQAEDVVAMARVEDWHRLLLVASAYHMPRAFLTFVQALLDVGAEYDIDVVPVPAYDAWFAPPEGLRMERIELLAVEEQKTELYQAKGDVASYDDGLAYLRAWEGKRERVA